MQPLNSFISLKSQPHPIILSETYLTKNISISHSKLSIIWLKESDGDRQRLIARWVKQD